MTVTAAQFQSLVDVGRRKGGLSTHDIQQVLPVEAMSADELAQTIARLEDMNIPVELDPSLQTPDHRSPPPLGRVREAVLPPGRTDASASPRQRADSGGAAVGNGGRAARADARNTAGKAIWPLLAGIALVLLLVAVWIWT
jgi:hypothetical protein